MHLFFQRDCCNFVLTAIVITFGVTTFLLGLAYRSWVLTEHDEVRDDVEDRRLPHRSGPDEEVRDLEAVDTVDTVESDIRAGER